MKEEGGYEEEEEEGRKAREEQKRRKLQTPEKRNSKIKSVSSSPPSVILKVMREIVSSMLHMHLLGSICFLNVDGFLNHIG